ncbi:MAG: ATP-dependent helicase [bacterium]|nr:ATP-dependent helicase [bacterium]
MLALAGAGSGKTRTLVYRVCRLIEDGISPNRILLLTFTNKAAKEMLDRVQRLIPHGRGRVSGGTFHSTGHRILRRYADVLGYSSRFSILDREDASDLMGQALADLSKEVTQRRTPKPRLLVDLYSFVINTGRDLEKVIVDRAPQYLDQAEIIAAVFRRYLERKRKADMMDFDDLLLNWLLLLQRHASVRSELKKQFDHVLVDEFQDTNRLQSDIIDSMLGPDRNLMVVGDDAQSIYAFRGADFDNILGFPDRYSDCEVFHLTLNYRSIPPILELANASIEHNTRQFPKMLEPVRKGTDLPRCVTTDSPEAQGRFIAEKILELREEGIPLEDMAVLYRNHSHSLEIQVELTRRNIPFRVRSGLRFFEQRHVKDTVAHLRFIENSRDELSFSRMLRLRRGFGLRLVAKVWNRISGADSLQTLRETPPRTHDLPQGARDSLTGVIKLLDEMLAPAFQTQPGEMIRKVLTEFYRQWALDNLENARSRIDDLDQLALFADGYKDLTSFLSEISLLNELSGEETTGGTTDEMLVLSTTHQAKGLEWSAVFLAWLAEGRFPSSRAEDEEEERRLFYVAVTRARDFLFLVRPLIARDRYRVDVLLDPSRFLLELPDEACDRVVVREQQEDDTEAQPEVTGRYSMPSFFDEPSDTPSSDDDVN